MDIDEFNPNENGFFKNYKGDKNDAKYIEKLDTVFFANNTILSFDNNMVTEIASGFYKLKFYNDSYLNIQSQPDKLKILKISNNNELNIFSSRYQFYLKNYEFHIQWHLVTKDYAGLIIEPQLVKDNITNDDYAWIDWTWYTDYGYIWRYKNVVKKLVKINEQNKLITDFDKKYVNNKKKYEVIKLSD